MKKIQLPLISFLLPYFLWINIATIQAQTAISPEPCGTMKVLKTNEQKDPYLQERRRLLEQKIQTFLQNPSNKKKLQNEIITIPVVVHVLYNDEEQNLPDEVIHSQIEVLNEDFRRLNADADETPDHFKNVAADSRIEFCLATRDPDGNPTTGITRTATEINPFPYNPENFESVSRMHFDERGGKNIWDRDRYLNVWVLNMGNSSNTTIAFAYLPGADPLVDGIVCRYEYFGRPSINGGAYDFGRTMTHEVGHWLNLYHTFNETDSGECSDDFVSDTPPQQNSTFGCPTFPNSSCDNFSDMFMNYMDYTDDSCATMFSQKQVERMKAALYITRPKILTSLACTPFVENDAQIQAINEPSPNYCLSTTVPFLVSLKNTGTAPLTSVNIHYSLDGETAKIFEWQGNIEPFATEENIFIDVITTTPNLHQLQVYTTQPNGTADTYPQTDTLYKAFTTGTGIVAPFTEDFETPYTDKGWYIKDVSQSVPWQQIGEAVNKDGSIGGIMAVKHDFHDYFDVIGTMDYLYSPQIDLSTLENPQLQFDVSYFVEIGKEDDLKVSVSTDCGFTYTQVYYQSGIALTTRTTAVPQSGSQWRTEKVNLSDFAGQQIILNFETKSGGGNWLMLDNVSITGNIVSTENISINTDNNYLYLNPLNNQLHLHFPSSQTASPTQLTLFDITGKALQTQTLSPAQNNITLSLAQLPTGIYWVNLSGKNGNWSRKFWRR